MSQKTWVVERRLVSENEGPHGWLALDLVDMRSDAELRFRLRSLYLRAGHELRLVAPDGRVIVMHKALSARVAA